MFDHTGQPNSDERKTIDAYTGLALSIVLVVYPLAYCSGIMRPVVVGIFAEDRSSWWIFWMLQLVFHGIPFALVWGALHRNREPWSSIGVDWYWFVCRRSWIAGVLLVFVIVAFVAPPFHYADQLPRVAKTTFMAPITTPERLFMIFIAIVAGVTEEVLFRGFPLTRLRRIIPNVWLILPITVASFVFIHGTPRGLDGALAYTLAGLAFGVPFILMKCRHLEMLIVIHFLIDAGMVLAP